MKTSLFNIVKFSCSIMPGSVSRDGTIEKRRHNRVEMAGIRLKQYASLALWNEMFPHHERWVEVDRIPVQEEPCYNEIPDCEKITLDPEVYQDALDLFAFANGWTMHEKQYDSTRQCSSGSILSFTTSPS